MSSNNHCDDAMELIESNKREMSDVNDEAPYSGTLVIAHPVNDTGSQMVFQLDAVDDTQVHHLEPTDILLFSCANDIDQGSSQNSPQSAVVGLPCQSMAKKILLLTALVQKKKELEAVSEKLEDVREFNRRARSIIPVYEDIRQKDRMLLMKAKYIIASLDEKIATLESEMMPHLPSEEMLSYLLKFAALLDAKGLLSCHFKIKLSEWSNMFSEK